MKKFLIILVILICIAFIIFLPKNKLSKHSTNKDENTSKLNVEKMLYRYSYSPSNNYKYKLEYKLEVSTRQQKKGSTENDYAMSINGILNKKVYKSAKGEFLVGYLVENPEIGVIASNEDALKMLGENKKEENLKIEELKLKHKERIEKALATEIFTSINNKGNIKKWYFPKSLSASSRNYLKGILVYGQILFPEDASNEWDIIQDDLNGKYLAKYTVQSTEHKSAIKILRKKIKYTNIESFDKAAKLPEINESKADVVFDSKSGHVVDVKLKEDINAEMGGFVFNTKAILNLTLKNITKEEVLAKKFKEENLSKEKMYITSSTIGEGEEEFEKRRLQNILGNLKYKDIIKMLDKLTDSAEDNEKRNELFRKLYALMKLQPESCDKVVEKVLASSKVNRNISTLISALGYADNEHAQKGLRNIIEKSQNKSELMLLSLPSLSISNQPNDKNLELIQKIKRENTDPDIKNTASLSLGTMADKFQKAKDPRAEAIVYDLAKELESSDSNDKKMIILDSLGNAANNSSIDTISKYVDSSNDLVKSKAFSALRGIEDEKADIILSENLIKEKSFTVRNSILDAMSNRVKKGSKYAFEALSQSVNKEKDKNLRIKSAIILWEMRRKFPEAESIIRKMAKEDPSEDVRNSIENVISTSE